MQPAISTYLFLPQRLTSRQLDACAAAGAKSIEVFSARHHFDYADAAAVRELASWFRSNDVVARLHMPLFTEETHWTRHTAPSINLISQQKSARIEAMDEVKRALESAEQVPFVSCTIHLGLKDDTWDTRALDDSLTAIEHLKAFAGPLGIQLLLENLPNEVATPEHLVEIVNVGHFSNVGFCLDLGHANLAEGVSESSQGPARTGIDVAFAALGPKLVQLHVHDNHGALSGKGDEHLWPLAVAEEGTIDWAAVAEHVAALPKAPVAVLEIAHDLGDAPDEAQLGTLAQAAWERVGASPA
jgi:sugar phosphate isomerase/epimerase